MMITYRFYPTLLNAFARFNAGKMTEMDLLNIINRVPVPGTPEQERGISFENAVIKGENEESFPAHIISEVRSLLPRPMVATQVYCEYTIDNVQIYGYVDVIGKSLAVDIKTTRHYEADRYVANHQNFYLPALKNRGIRTLRYVITDFEKVYQENYDLNTDFTEQKKEINAFCEFIETHRNEITDRKVFGGR